MTYKGNSGDSPLRCFFLPRLTCSSDDDDKGITKEIIMNVSAEPGVIYDLFGNMGEHPIECMQVMTEDEPGRWLNLYFTVSIGSLYVRNDGYVHCA